MQQVLGQLLSSSFQRSYSRGDYSTLTRSLVVPEVMRGLGSHRRSTGCGLLVDARVGEVVATGGTWTFQVAPEAGWARRSGPVTLRARLMPTAARGPRPRRPRQRAAHACSLSAPVHLRPNSVNKNYDA